jgi:hypothetical protein
MSGKFNVLSHTLKAATGTNGDSELVQETLQPHRWWLPYTRWMRMTQEAKGVFIPYPLLAIMVTLGLVIVGGIVAIQVQVSNLSTVILLRDADQRAVTQELKEKTEQLQVYIYDSREKLVRLQAEVGKEEDKRR